MRSWIKCDDNFRFEHVEVPKLYYILNENPSWWSPRGVKFQPKSWGPEPKHALIYAQDLGLPNSRQMRNSICKATKVIKGRAKLSLVFKSYLIFVTSVQPSNNLYVNCNQRDEDFVVEWRLDRKMKYGQCMKSVQYLAQIEGELDLGAQEGLYLRLLLGAPSPTIPWFPPNLWGSKPVN